jgi:hypothetical protein
MAVWTRSGVRALGGFYSIAALLSLFVFLRILMAGPPRRAAPDALGYWMLLALGFLAMVGAIAASYAFLAVRPWARRLAVTTNWVWLGAFLVVPVADWLMGELTWELTFFIVGVVCAIGTTINVWFQKWTKGMK